MERDREIKEFLEKAKSLPAGDLDAYKAFCNDLTRVQMGDGLVKNGDLANGLAADRLATELQMPEKKPLLGLKALVFADTHGCFEKRDAFESFIYAHPQYDVCLLLGDHTAGDLDMLLQYIPEHKVFGVLGNHNMMDLYDRFGIMNNVHGQVMSFRGIRIGGIYGSHRYKSVPRPMLTQYESLQLADDMVRECEPADILITHDKAFVQKEYDTAHVGLAGINYYIDRAKPVWHLCGHYHVNEEGMYGNGTRLQMVYGGKYVEL